MRCVIRQLTHWLFPMGLLCASQSHTYVVKVIAPEVRLYGMGLVGATGHPSLELRAAEEALNLYKTSNENYNLEIKYQKIIKF